MTDTDELLEVAEGAVRDAGGAILEMSRAGSWSASTKSGPRDLLTSADQESERILVQRLTEARPSDGIVSEEGAAHPSSSGLTWIMDPLDGTTNFVHSRPRWCVSIACVDETGELVGCTYDPTHDEFFAATRSGGAFLNGAPIAVTDVAELTDALVGTGFAYDTPLRELQGRQVARVVGRVRDLRRAGSPCLDLADVACGRLDGFYEVLSAPWDRAAGTLLVREAGGVVSYEPGPLGEHQIVAAGRNLFGALTSIVGEPLD